MFLVRFIDATGGIDHETKYGYLDAAMRAINLWFTETHGRGECHVAYAG